MPQIALNDVKKRLYDAYTRGDKSALEAAVRDYKAGKASLRRSKENIASDQESYNPTNEMGGLERAAVGNASALVNLGRRGANLVGVDKVGDFDTSDEAIKSQEKTDEALLNTRGGGIGRFVGDVGLTAPLSGGSGAGIRAVGAAANAAKKAGMLTRALSYAAEGAVGGELTNGAGAEGAGINLALTPALNRAGRLLKTVGRGMDMTPEARVLQEHGSDLTPGLMDPHGWMGRIERTAETSPLLGRGIAEARKGATRDVVQNLASDVEGIARRPGETLQASAIRRGEKISDAYSGVDGHPLAPDELAKVSMGTRRKFNEAGSARRLATREAERDLQAIDDRVAARRSKLIKAEDRLRRNTNPDIQEALEEDVGIANRQLNAARAAAADANRRAPVLAGREASAEAREGFVHEATNELEKTLNRSLRDNGMAEADRTALQKEIRYLSNRVISGKDTTAVRKARSQLRELKASYKYARNDKQVNNAAVRVIENVEGWFDAQLDKAFKSAGRPELTAKLKEADDLYAQTRALSEASHSAQSRLGSEIEAKDLAKGLRENMTDEAFSRGGGGKVREVAEALSKVREKQPTGFMERLPMLHTILSVLATPSSAALASKPMRRMLQGGYKYQKNMSAAARRKEAQMLKRTLQNLRPALAGAMADKEDRR